MPSYCLARVYTHLTSERIMRSHELHTLLFIHPIALLFKPETEFKKNFV